jgi:hypothetical protein
MINQYHFLGTLYDLRDAHKIHLLSFSEGWWNSL